MAHFVGLDVSVRETSVCVVDDAGKVILEQKVLTEPDDIIALLSSLGVTYGRIGIEAGPLSQWLVNALTAADLPVICVETRHMKALLTAQQINKTDRNDARGIAQMMRVWLFKPVHVKTLVAQEQRMLLTSRKLLQRKLLDLESDLRGTPPAAGDFFVRGWGGSRNLPPLQPHYVGVRSSGRGSGREGPRVASE